MGDCEVWLTRWHPGGRSAQVTATDTKTSSLASERSERQRKGTDQEDVPYQSNWMHWEKDAWVESPTELAGCFEERKDWNFWLQTYLQKTHRESHELFVSKSCRAICAISLWKAHHTDERYLLAYTVELPRVLLFSSHFTQGNNNSTFNDASCP